MIIVFTDPNPSDILRNNLRCFQRATLAKNMSKPCRSGNYKRIPSSNALLKAKMTFKLPNCNRITVEHQYSKTKKPSWWNILALSSPSLIIPEKKKCGTQFSLGIHCLDQLFPNSRKPSKNVFLLEDTFLEKTEYLGQQKGASSLKPACTAGTPQGSHTRGKEMRGGL